jgi:bifunctional DNA-binding transcriptional regulator/antitoxin component of YhaV-PrlF toxin-antitoxin module
MSASSATLGGPVVVQLRERGQLTIPAVPRREMGLEDGDVFTLTRVGDTLVATRRRLVSAGVAEAIQALMQERDLTLDDLLADLEKQREAYVSER